MSRANSSVVARELLVVSWLVDRQAQRCGVIRWNESSVSPPSSRSTTGKGPHEQLSHCRRCPAEVSSCAIRAVLECPSDLDHSAVTLYNHLQDPCHDFRGWGHVGATNKCFHRLLLHGWCCRCCCLLHRLLHCGRASKSRGGENEMRTESLLEPTTNKPHLPHTTELAHTSQSQEQQTKSKQI